MRIALVNLLHYENKGLPQGSNWTGVYLELYCGFKFGVGLG